MIEVIFNVSGELDETHGMHLAVTAAATPKNIMLALAATIQDIWRTIDADDSEVGDLFRSDLRTALNDPRFWTREEESSHD